MNEAQRVRMSRRIWLSWILGDVLMVLGLIWVMMSSGTYSGLVRVGVFAGVAAVSVFLLVVAVKAGRKLLATIDPPADATPPPTALVTAVFVVPALLLALIRL